MHTYIETMLQRRSVRSYTAQRVDQDSLEQVLLAGLHAPSAHDSRPWRFLVFDGAQKEALVDVLAQPFARDMAAANLPPQEIQRRLTRSGQIFRQAPVIILGLCAQKKVENPLDETGTVEPMLATQSLAIAGAQMMQAAHGLGLGACWFTAPLFCQTELAQAFGWDTAQWQCHYMLTLGHPDPDVAPKAKRPVNWAQSIVMISEKRDVDL